jgi:cytochrome c biogenesis protein
LAEEELKENKDTFEAIWSFLASVKLAVAVFIILALSSIIGTIVEQQAEPEKNIALLAKFFGDSAAPTAYNIFAQLGFMDMYRSWWFVGFLSLFSVNLIVCSIDRFPKTWKLINLPLRHLAENAIRALPLKKEIRLHTPLPAAKEEFRKAMKSSGFHVLESNDVHGVQLYGQKWKYARLGVYVVHLSIILIFIGAIIGARFGFSGFLNLPEGQTSDVAFGQDGKPIPLGFSIKCNWYDTSYYEGLDTPKEFQSELVVLDNGKEVMKKVIEVNSPLSYKGITFFQSSYGMLQNERGGYFILTVTPNGGSPKTISLRFGDKLDIPGTGIKGTIVDFSPALGRDSRTGALTTYSENMVNPAVGIEFDVPGQKSFKGWVLKRYPETGILQDGSSIKFEDYWGVEYTGLSVSKDPGVWLIYTACIFMAIGLYVAFFISHRKLWVHFTHEAPGDKGPLRISVGGNTSRNRFAFEKEVDHMLSKISQAIEGKHANK